MFLVLLVGISVCLLDYLKSSERLRNNRLNFGDDLDYDPDTGSG